MNTLLLKYALEVGHTNSISKAAENLYMNQPHLSKAIKELEATVGFAIFERSPKGVFPTDDGVRFLEKAESILKEVDELEQIGKGGFPATNQNIEVSVSPLACTTNGFANFLKSVDLKSSINIDYRACDIQDAISRVTKGLSRLAIVRIKRDIDKAYVSTLSQSGLKVDTLCEYALGVLMSRDCALGKKLIIKDSDLKDCTRIELGKDDNQIRYLPQPFVLRQSEEEKSINIKIRDKMMAFCALSKIPNSYIWSAPVSEDILSKYNLVLRSVSTSQNLYKDILIYKYKTKFSSFEKSFINYLKDAMSHMNYS